MILRRYGTTMQSVELNFSAQAMNEIGFLRDHQTSIPVDDFRTDWEKVEERAFEATAEGWVQNDTEQELLDRLEARIRELEEELGEDEVLLVESEQGQDYPKTRHRQNNVIEEGENRLHFEAWVEPPLRMGRYRKR